MSGIGKMVKFFVLVTLFCGITVQAAIANSLPKDVRKKAMAEQKVLHKSMSTVKDPEMRAKLRESLKESRVKDRAARIAQRSVEGVN